MATITAANSVFMLSIANLFSTSQSLEGFATDDAFAAESVDMAEVRLGVDGKLSAGFVPVLFPMTISFQADSPSILMFDTWGGAQLSARELLKATGVISLPGTGKIYTLTQGILTGFKPMPDVKKVLEPQQYKITWGSIIPSSV